MNSNFRQAQTQIKTHLLMNQKTLLSNFEILTCLSFWKPGAHNQHNNLTGPASL